MGWHNPAISWGELERILSGRKPGPERTTAQRGTGRASTQEAEQAAAAAAEARKTHPYAELHVHSHYSFLDGASSPEALIAEAAGLGLTALAITDHDGLQGAADFAEAATDHPELETVYGAELSLGLDAPQLGAADPQGTHLLLLAQGVSGYHRLASAITDGQLAGGEKGRPVYDLEALAAKSSGEWAVLTGCRKGAVRRALDSVIDGSANRSDGEAGARAALERLTSLFGHDRVFVELTDHGHPGDDTRNDLLAALATEAHLPTLATGAVHYATAEEAPLAEAMAAIRSRRSLDELDPYLPASGAAHLRSGAAMYRRFARHPAAVARAALLGRELAFPLRAARPKLPKLDVPDGHTLNSWLRELAYRGAESRYDMGDPRVRTKVEARLERELSLIEEKDFPGYFLIVHDIVEYARSLGILCQGRGSAASSAVCYVLRVTEVDAIFYNLPFERFLSSMRDEEPDIDIDFESGQREEVIQYVYEKYGRRNAAQVANVISYRPRSAIRDAAKALGYSPAQQLRLAKLAERWGEMPLPDPAPGASDEPREDEVPADVRRLADGLMRGPRHLGIHSGGMVLTEQPVGEVCPIEHARMPNRTVLQWDKDACASMGLVKFDLLGLGMLSALRITMELAAAATGERWTLDTLPKEEPGVYDMLCRADAIGVFQLESRAQLNTLPRLKPRNFYDLAVEIALIRPGPLQGGAVHPYLRRRDKIDKVTYPHPLLEPVLERTLGVPIFQEQLMEMARAVGNCDAEDADYLRRAMGSKRGIAKFEKMKAKLFAGMRENGIEQDQAERLYAQIEAFADFGFAESHSISFALLVYASAWLKLHYPAAFLAGLLRSQPMGFYSPRTLTEDARRHGVQVLPPDVQRSGAHAGLEAIQDQPAHARRDSCVSREQPPIGAFDRDSPDTSGTHRRDGAFAVRIGLSEMRGITEAVAERIVAARATTPFADLADLARRADLDAEQLEALATAGACEGLGIGRREALWSAAPAAENRERFLPGIAVYVQPPLLPVLTEAEQTELDLWTTGVVSGRHPLALMREALDARGVRRSDTLASAPPGSPVRVAGLVTHRQRPRTAGGITFVTLEDEAGSVNVVVWSDVWQRHRLVARSSPALLISGALERSPDGVLNVIAGDFEPLPAPTGISSRDFQ